MLKKLKKQLLSTSSHKEPKTVKDISQDTSDEEDTDGSSELRKSNSGSALSGLVLRRMQEDAVAKWNTPDVEESQVESPTKTRRTRANISDRGGGTGGNLRTSNNSRQGLRTTKSMDDGVATVEERMRTSTRGNRRDGKFRHSEHARRLRVDGFDTKGAEESPEKITRTRSPKPRKSPATRSSSRTPTGKKSTRRRTRSLERPNRGEDRKRSASTNRTSATSSQELTELPVQCSASSCYLPTQLSINECAELKKTKLTRSKSSQQEKSSMLTNLLANEDEEDELDEECCLPTQLARSQSAPLQKTRLKSKNESVEQNSDGSDTLLANEGEADKEEESKKVSSMGDLNIEEVGSELKRISSVLPGDVIAALRKQRSSQNKDCGCGELKANTMRRIKSTSFDREEGKMTKSEMRRVHSGNLNLNFISLDPEGGPQNATWGSQHSRRTKKSSLTSPKERKSTSRRIRRSSLCDEGKAPTERRASRSPPRLCDEGKAPTERRASRSPPRPAVAA